MGKEERLPSITHMVPKVLSYAAGRIPTTEKSKLTMALRNRSNPYLRTTFMLENKLHSLR